MHSIPWHHFVAQNANRNAETHYFQYKIFGLEIYFLPFYSKFWVIFFPRENVC